MAFSFEVRSSLNCNFSCLNCYMVVFASFTSLAVLSERLLRLSFKVFISYFCPLITSLFFLSSSTTILFYSLRESSVDFRRVCLELTVARDYSAALRFRVRERSFYFRTWFYY